MTDAMKPCCAASRSAVPACCAASREAMPEDAPAGRPAAETPVERASDLAPEATDGQRQHLAAEAAGERAGQHEAETMNRGARQSAGTPVPAHVSLSADSGSDPREGLVELPGGAFTMGTNSREGFPQDGEGPERRVELSPFYISPYAVTNRQFARFVEATGYVTEAEKFGWSYVFHLLVSEEIRAAVEQVPQQVPWWYVVHGAYWAKPEGPDSTLADRMDHPAVHVSWNDAQAYCRWSGTRLPTEAEWEYAARGGLERKTYPWGDLLKPDGEHRCNIWQGKFPEKNSAADGYVGTAPVDAYQPNGFGLYNVSGNVWEWCADWFSPSYHRETAARNPRGEKPTGKRSMRGGSYLCHRSYCNRYRVAARSSNTPDSSTGNCGFRVAADKT